MVAVTDTPCAHCGGELGPQLNAGGVARCLTCGKGTMRPCGAELECGGTCPKRPSHAGDHGCNMPRHHHNVPEPGSCCAPLFCGGICALPKGHGEGHVGLCDTNGPGSCPAG